MNFDLGKSKRFGYVLLGVALALGLIVALLGGGVFTSFGLMFILGVFVGWNGKRLKQLISDYRLALRINAIMFSSKEMEKHQREKAELVEEVRQLRERIAGYNVLKEGGNV